MWATLSQSSISHVPLSHYRDSRTLGQHGESTGHPWGQLGSPHKHKGGRRERAEPTFDIEASAGGWEVKGVHTRCRSEEWSVDTLLLLPGQKLAREAQTDRHAHTGGRVAPRGDGGLTTVCAQATNQPNVILPFHYYKKHKYKQALQKYIYKTNMQFIRTFFIAFCWGHSSQTSTFADPPPGCSPP